MKRGDKEFNDEVQKLSLLSDEDINTSDIPEIDDWSKATQGEFYRPVKKPINIRLDSDIIAWFKSKNKKYQSKINEVLRKHMLENLEN